MKSVDPKGFAGSNPVCSAVTMADLAMQRIVVPPYMGSNPIIRIQAGILWKLLLKAKVVEEIIIRPEGYNL